MVEVWTLPCSRGRHHACGGRVVHGFGLRSSTYCCGCSCHIHGVASAHALATHSPTMLEPASSPSA